MHMQGNREKNTLKGMVTWRKNHLALIKVYWNHEMQFPWDGFLASSSPVNYSFRLFHLTLQWNVKCKLFKPDFWVEWLKSVPLLKWQERTVFFNATSSPPRPLLPEGGDSKTIGRALMHPMQSCITGKPLKHEKLTVVFADFFHTLLKERSARFWARSRQKACVVRSLR